MNKREILERLSRGEKEFDIARMIVAETRCSYSKAHDAIRRASKNAYIPTQSSVIAGAAKPKTIKRVPSTMVGIYIDQLIQLCTTYKVPRDVVIANMMAYCNYTYESAENYLEEIHYAQ